MKALDDAITWIDFYLKQMAPNNNSKRDPKDDEHMRNIAIDELIFIKGISAALPDANTPKPHTLELDRRPPKRIIDI